MSVAGSFLKRSAAIAVACVTIGAYTHVAAQLDDLRLPVIIDADRTDYDGRTAMLMFSGLRLTQGGIGIQADVARASRMDFDDSVWHFEGNVVFDIDEGHITCDSADLQFRDFQLQVATIEGSPATFEFRRAGRDQPTYAEATRLEYDLIAGTIRFSGGATINEDGNQISSDTLVYNIREQRINAAGNGNDRVTVTYTPPEADSDDTAQAPDDSDAPDVDDGAAEEPPE